MRSSTFCLLVCFFTLNPGGFKLPVFRGPAQQKHTTGAVCLQADCTTVSFVACFLLYRCSQ